MSSFIAVNARDTIQTPPPNVDRALAIPPNVAAAICKDAEAKYQPSDADSEVPAIRPRRMLCFGANKVVNDAFCALCNTYLANDRPPTMQACAEAAMERYEDGGLNAQQLADCMSGFYDAI